MSIGRQSIQTTFSQIAAFLGRPVVAKESIYALIKDFRLRLPEELFEPLYKVGGRPSISPVLLSCVMLLQFHDNVSDREAVERAAYDVRWIDALGTEMGEPGFSQASLVNFRMRLLQHQQERIVFDQVIELARQQGIVTGTVKIIDSTAVIGAGAVQDTYTLIRTAIQKAMGVSGKRHHGRHQQMLDLLDGRTYEEAGKPNTVQWDDPQSRSAYLNELVQDGMSVLTVLKEAEDLSDEEAQAMTVLQHVLGQDVEMTPTGQFAIRDGVAKDRVVSVGDPAMRHGHKSSRGLWDGYKAHVVIDEATELIENVEITAANVPDGAAVTDVIEPVPNVDVLLGDCAYGTMAQRIERETQQIEVVSPVVNAVNGDKFTKDAFTIDLDNETCRCPGGQEAQSVQRSRQGKLKGFQFAESQCANCPMRGQCCKGKGGRIVRVHPHERERQAARAKMNTPEYQELYRKRPKIERKIGEIVGHGMRRARYIGKAKTKLQLLFTSSVVNIKRIAKLASAIDGRSLPLRPKMA